MPFGQKRFSVNYEKSDWFFNWKSKKKKKLDQKIIIKHTKCLNSLIYAINVSSPRAVARWPWEKIFQRIKKMLYSRYRGRREFCTKFGPLNYILERRAWYHFKAWKSESIRVFKLLNKHILTGHWSYYNFINIIWRSLKP